MLLLGWLNRVMHWWIDRADRWPLHEVYDGRRD